MSSGNRSKPKLKLLFRDLMLEVDGSFDAQAAHYVYASRHNGAIYLQDLSADSVRMLVPPNTNALFGFSMPRFYRDEVIYSRNGILWRVGLDGSNNIPLFPQTDNLAEP